MFRFLNLLLIVFFNVTSLCRAETYTTNDFNRLEKSIQTAEPGTWVIFDVDDVLLEPDDEILTFHNKSFLKHIEKGLEERIGKETAEKLYSMIFTQRTTHPVNERMVSLINETQARGLKTLALTNCFTGSFGEVSSIENWRVQELKNLGYHFARSWQTLGTKYFKDLKSKGSERHPAFKEGIIFASDVPKGEALKAFLQHLGSKPKNIIFIDDKRKHINTVEATAKEFGITFLGIEYTAVKDSTIKSLNKDRALLQFEILENEHIWLSDQKIDALMKVIENKKENNAQNKL